MMSEEGWIMHGMEAIERIIKHEILTRYSYTNLAGHIGPYERMSMCS